MAADASTPSDALRITVPAGTAGQDCILTPAAKAFVARLGRRYESRRCALLEARQARQAAWDAGDLPDFDPDTRSIREGDWQVAPIPEVLRDRRVEITGPVDRKMVINALNSGARVFMADFEDSCSPTWDALIQGQINLRDAVDGRIEYTAPDGRHYQLRGGNTVLMVRPRGWHLEEKHALLDGHPVSASLFDLALFAFHNAQALQSRGLGPFFYLPKLEHACEAALWNDVLDDIEAELALPTGTMKVTVLIETLPAAFQMHEILHALRTRIVGLNCGRWDYIFSTIKTSRAHADRVLPERGQVGMTAPFLKAYSELLIKTCHRRGALAMGGMAAQIPINSDPVANEAAMAKVRADKKREAEAGHDGTWVAHPGLIPVALAEFDRCMPDANQLEVSRDDVIVGRDDLLAVPAGTITAAGYRANIEIAVRYLAAWLDGLGCVPIHHLMEDAATAEISRSQLWQWQHHGARLDDGTRITAEMYAAVSGEVLAELQRDLAPSTPGYPRLVEAAGLLARSVNADTLVDFLTLPAYDRLP
ncbi:malate synthase A [Pseudofulvimonas gallinarii]|uniref:malate synthase n=1 Tax=Pseudofulvimonas gallinarii TaxID=634155 RepID=A0A4R3LIN0_9GAMM|nr:malate synthase A [Pseudofulvimonas gallinarii]TCS99600.1 malate synthase [Pseudofulvimonas gallinarii]THD14827.1 malate synthase A [Pseudofulvimonas gallinarii]